MNNLINCMHQKFYICTPKNYEAVTQTLSLLQLADLENAVLDK